MSPRDVFEAIVRPEGNELMLALLRDVGSHPLLRYRVHQAWKDMHDPKTVRRQMLLSEKRLAWHLQRIYRARNMTVHKGRPPSYLPALIGHVQYYFSRCVSRVFADLALHSDWSVSTSLENHRQLFDFIARTLQVAAVELPATLLFSSEDFAGFHPWAVPRRTEVQQHRRFVRPAHEDVGGLDVAARRPSASTTGFNCASVSVPWRSSSASSGSPSS